MFVFFFSRCMRNTQRIMFSIFCNIKCNSLHVYLSPNLTRLRHGRRPNQGAATLTMAANDSVCAFSVSGKLQTQLLEVRVLDVCGKCDLNVAWHVYPSSMMCLPTVNKNLVVCSSFDNISVVYVSVDLCIRYL